MVDMVSMTTQESDKDKDDESVRHVGGYSPPCREELSPTCRAKIFHLSQSDTESETEDEYVL